MGRIKTSKIWSIDKKELQFLLDNSNSKAEVIEKIGLDPYSGNHRTLDRRIKEEDLDLTQLKENRILISKQRNKASIPINNLLVENSNYNRAHLKKRLVANKLLEYKCASCGLKDLWNKKPISLQLDHINGINNDNRLENLRFLCPNCHSQTETFCGKHRKTIYSCIDCGKNIQRRSERCRSCSSALINKKQIRFEVTKEELTQLIEQYPITTIGKMFNVSDTAIRKRCRKLGIDIKLIKKITKSL